MRFPKPALDQLVAHYRKEPESVHDCPRIYRKDPATHQPGINTCAIRLSEALVLANRLVTTRAAMSALTSGGGNGKAFLLGPYGFRANLCPHGLARGAADLAYFLKDAWGAPNVSVRGGTGKSLAPTANEIGNQDGVIAFIKIDGFDGQGHVDVWKDKAPIGAAYWSCERVMFWRLE